MEHYKRMYVHAPVLEAAAPTVFLHLRLYYSSLMGNAVQAMYNNLFINC